MDTGYAHSELLVETDWLTAHLDDPNLRLVDADYAGAWELPVLGHVAAPAAVLIRPDGYVAWVGDGGTDTGLREALTIWFGAR